MNRLAKNYTAHQVKKCKTKCDIDSVLKNFSFQERCEIMQSAMGFTKAWYTTLKEVTDEVKYEILCSEFLSFVRDKMI